MTTPLPPDPDSLPPPSNNLIAQHLRMFQVAADAGIPESSTEPYTVDLPLQRSSNAEQKRAKGRLSWLPWGITGSTVLLALCSWGMSPKSHPPESAHLQENEASNPSTQATSSEGSSERVLAQLLAAPPLPHSPDATMSGMLAASTMSADAWADLRAKFKDISAGRKDPFISLAINKPPTLPMSPPRLARLPSPIPPSPTPEATAAAPTPSPIPPATLRVLGVVEGDTPIALLELTHAGVVKKERVGRNDPLFDGYRVAEITPKQLILHTSTKQVISAPIGSPILLEAIPATPSTASKWQKRAASR